MSRTLPPDFVAQMQELLPVEWPSFAAAIDQQSVPVSVHFHPHKSIAGSWSNEDQVLWNPTGRYLPERPSFTLDPSFHAGAYYVQEASSMLVAHALKQLFPIDQPLRVLDLCAAPGGKSTLLTSHLPAGSWLLANEVIRSRYQILRYNLAKWGYPNTFTSNHDVEHFAPLAGFFDLVLVDAPCSGEGLFRKDEAARAEWSLENVSLCTVRQQRILRMAQSLVAPGGALIYSTCTYNQQENEHNALRIAEQPEWSAVELSCPDEWGFVNRTVGVQAYPHRVRGEGFYLAALRKTAGEVQRAKPPSGFKKMTPLTKAKQREVVPWIKDADTQTIWETTSGQWRVLPKYLVEDAQRLARHLNKLEVGTPLGEWKGKGLVPAPEWALSLACHPNLPVIEVDEETALALLRKQTPTLAGLGRGWHLVRYRGLGLGWVKGLGNRYNNYYPTNWRIRM